jgi:hypothetical protein
MRYTVVWIPSAEADLAQLWMDAPDRNLLSQSADRIDHSLARDPAGIGESRDAGRRILLIPPLGVLYRVKEEDQIVRVLNVWQSTAGPTS